MSAAIVEVKDDETLAWYAGYIRDYRDSDNNVLVHFENGWKADEWIEPSKVRQSVPCVDQRAFQPKTGDCVEAMTKTNPDEPFSWWHAVVKTVRGEFFMIGYLDWDDSYNEIVEKEVLRPVNPNPVLVGEELRKITLDLPKSMWDTPAADETFRQQKVETFLDVQKTSGVLSVIEDAKNHLITVIGYQQPVDRCKVLCQLAFKQHAEKLKLKRRLQQSREFLESEKKKVLSGVVVEFKIPAKLIGIVIGKKGKQIESAKKIDGIISVKVSEIEDNIGQVKIVAKDEETANKARVLLEYVEEHFTVAKKSIWKFVGPKFAQLRELEKAAKDVRITLPKGNFQEQIALSVVGRKDAVQNTLVLLKRHLDFVNECEQLERDNREVDNELLNLSNQYGINGRPNRNKGTNKRYQSKNVENGNRTDEKESSETSNSENNNDVSANNNNNSNHSPNKRNSRGGRGGRGRWNRGRGGRGRGGRGRGGRGRGSTYALKNNSNNKNEENDKSSNTSEKNDSTTIEVPKGKSKRTPNKRRSRQKDDSSNNNDQTPADNN